MSNNQKTIDYAEANNLTTVETTSQANGYPSNLRQVLIFDRITDALNNIDHLKSKGHEVTELMLHKRDGWDLWCRSNGSISKGMFRKTTGKDFTVEVSIEEDADEIAFNVVAHGAEYESLSDLKRKTQLTEDFSEAIEHILEEMEDIGQTFATVFYDPDQNYRIDYYATDETVGYSYDTHHYMAALMVDFKEDEQEDTE